MSEGNEDVNETKGKLVNPSAAGPADDVATLYSWANLHGAKYRDFSASRQELRTQTRHRLNEIKVQPDASGLPVMMEETTAAPAPAQATPEIIVASSTPTPPAIHSSQETPMQDYSSSIEADQAPIMPAWLNEAPRAARPPRAAAPAQLRREVRPSSSESARWAALHSLFTTGDAARPAAAADLKAPVLALFSLAGGVGKTCLSANLARALSSRGERTLVAETTPYGVLPFYFGAQDLRPGVVRTFASDLMDAPIQVISTDAESHVADSDESNWLLNDLARVGKDVNRIIIDLTGGIRGTIRKVLPLNATVVIPVTPDMSSVVSLQAVQSFFRDQLDSKGQQVRPYFLLNQFDPSLPLHVDMREMLRRQFGDRLLPFVIHRGSEVSEALAEGLTVIDYAPNSRVAEDIVQFAGWVRTSANAGASTNRGARWSER